MSFVIITAADAHYFELVQGAIRSVREKPQGQTVAIGFVDLGCTDEQLQWLQQTVTFIQRVDWEFEFPGQNTAPEHLKGLLVRPFLPKYFPGFEQYLWLDADAWVQDWTAIELYIQGAARRGLAVVPELERSSPREYGMLPKFWEWAAYKYQLAYGEDIGRELCSYPMLNAGVFALRHDAPHWQVWADCLKQGLQQSTALIDHLALNLAVYGYGLFEQTEILPSWCNWTCHYCGLPAWNSETAQFVEPYLPHTPIGILHLTDRKLERAVLKTTTNDRVAVSLRYGGSSQEQPEGLLAPSLALKNLEPEQFPAGDYVSPGFATVLPDRCFPHMVIGNTDHSHWLYLRREIPHNWYVDQRQPSTGFLSRDEAHILYNTALQMQGKPALEIGCWLGWSACHLALAGVQLDIIDPLLEQPDFYESVHQSLQAAGVLDRVQLIPGYSPAKVEAIAAVRGRQWSLIFIDGNHDAPAPLQDAIACEALAAPDALILFHDLASPDVAQGLDYLRQRGWHTLVYQTMQIMGVAWRGNVAPVHHRPDPSVEWHLPEHLQSYTVSGLEALAAPGEPSPLQRQLRRDLKLNQINLIVFPDWQQPEDVLLPDLAPIIKALLVHPDRGRITLLINGQDVTAATADLAISSIVMELLSQDDIDVTTLPEIVLVDQLSQNQWQALRALIQQRIVMPHETPGAIANAHMEELPTLSLADLQHHPL